MYAHAKQNNVEDNENLFGSESEILQEAQVSLFPLLVYHLSDYYDINWGARNS